MFRRFLCALLTLFAAQALDFNRDNKCDLTDFGIVKNNMGMNPATYEQGDADGNCQVDLSDFGIQKNNMGIDWITFPY